MKVHVRLEGSPEELQALRSAIAEAYPQFAEVTEPEHAVACWVLDEALDRAAARMSEDDLIRFREAQRARRVRVEGVPVLYGLVHREK